MKFTDLRLVERTTAHYLEGEPEKVLFVARSEPEVEYPKHPEKHKIEEPRAEPVNFEESLPRYLGGIWPLGGK